MTPFGQKQRVCQRELPFSEVCCLLGTWVKYSNRKSPNLVHSSHFYLLLLCHVGANEVTVRSPRAIKREFKALARLLKASGIQVVFSSVLPVLGIDTKRQIQLINTWLWGWCHNQKSGGFDHEITCTTPGLLGLTGFTFLNGWKIFISQVSRADWKTFRLG